MKKFTSILLMLFFALSGLFAANMKGGEVFYLTPHTTWNSDNARYAIYFFNNSTGKNTWVSMSKVEGESNLWTGTVPTGDWANLIFCRMNPSASSNGWGSGVYWGGQTQDLTWDGTKNWFKVDSSKDAWNKPAGTWSTYTPPTPDPEPEPEPEPEDPDTPVDPEDPDQPVDPEDPDQPVDPEDPDTPVDPEDPDTPVDPDPANTITITFASDWAAANFYAWNTAGELTATWPGDAMTAADGKFTYELTLPEGDYSFIINNGNGTQTVNNEGVAESTCFVLDESQAGKWTLAVSADCEATDPKPIETSYVLMGVGGDWNTGIAMTPNPDNADEYVVKGQPIAATDAVKVVVFSAEGTNYCGNVKDGSVAVTYDDMGNIMLAEGTYDFYYSISENAIYIGASLSPDPDQPVDPEDPDTPVDPEDPDQPVDPEDPDTPVDPENPDQPVDPEDPDTPVEPATTITISFASDWETANFYAWTADGEITATWPGDAMTAADGKFTYELTLPEGDYSFIINNGNGTQTVNNEGVAESTCFVLDENKAGKWTLAVSADCEAVEPKPIETSYVLMGVGGDWNTGIAMTPNPDNADEYVVMGQAISAATDAVKVVVFSAEGTIYCSTVKEGSAEYTQDGMQNIVLADGTYDFYYSISENAIYIGASLSPDPDQPVDPEDPDTPVDPEDPDTPVDPEPVMITLYYVNNQGWSSVNAYAWGENPIATWPGEAATKTDLTAKGYDVYSYTFDSSLAANIIFNGDGNQTADLVIDPSKPYFYIDQWYASLEDIEAISSIEELAAYNIYATNGTIYADCEFAIYNLGGIDVTAQNGSLEGNYVVKTQKGSLLISVW